MSRLESSIVGIVVVLLFVWSAGGASAKKIVVPVRAAAVSEVVPADESLPSFHVIQISLPASVDSVIINSAVLEIVLDVDVRVRGDWRILDADSVEHVGYENPTPLLEIYPVPAVPISDVDPGSLDRSKRVVVPVSNGSERQVAANVTDLVKLIVRQPERTGVLLLGSFRGMREGEFDIDMGSFTDGAVGRLNIFCSDVASGRELPQSPQQRPPIR